MRTILGMALKVAALAGITFVGGQTAGWAENLRLAHHHAVGGAVDTAAKRFADIVKEKSEDRIQIRVFPAAQLGQEREAYDLMEQGGIDISITTTSFLDKNYRPIALTSMPFIFRDWDHAMAAYGGAFGEAIRANVKEASNTEILAYLGVGFRDLFFAGEPVTTLSGMSGLKMRSPENYAYIQMFELMGAIPTPVTWGEVYTAMQTGVAAGFDAPPGVAADSKLHEVSKGVLRSNHMFSAMVFAMNKHKLASLPTEDQEILRAAAKDAAKSTNLEVTIPAEQAAYKTFADAGLAIVEPENPEEWRDAMKPMIDEVVRKNPGTDKLLELIAN